MRGQTGPDRDCATRAARRRALLAKPDLAQAAAELRRPRASAIPTSAPRAGDLAEDCVADDLAARGLLERGGVEVGDVVEVVLRAASAAAAARGRASQQRGDRARRTSPVADRRP